MPTTVDGRLAALEDRLKDLRELSELLSVKYNPFLSLEETSSEDSYDAQKLLQYQLHDKKEDPALDAALATVVRPPHRPVLSDVPGTPSEPPPAPPQPYTMPPEAEPQTPPAPASPAPSSPPDPTRTPAAAPPPAPAPAASAPETPRSELPRQVGRFGRNGPATAPGEKALFQARGATIGGPRESFLAMHWFTYLSQGTDSSIIFHYLDYYRYTGWIDEENHAWLHRLAEGVATPKPDATWADFGMSTDRLAEKHLRNLRFLDKLLGTTLQHGEADYLQQTLDMLLED